MVVMFYVAVKHQVGINAIIFAVIVTYFIVKVSSSNEMETFALKVNVHYSEIKTEIN